MHLNTCIMPLLSLPRGSQIRLRRARILDRGSPHIPPVLRFVVQSSPMHRAPVIPDHEIANRPPVGVNKLGLCRMLDQIPDQHPAIRDRPANYVRGVRREIQRLSARPGMHPHHGSVHGRRGGAFGFREVGKPSFEREQKIECSADRSWIRA